MTTKTQTTRRREVDVARVAWVFSYVVPLILIALLFAAKSAHAATAEPPLAPAPGLDEELEEGFGGEDCEMDEEGFVYCEELEEDEEAEEGPHPPEDCLLRSAKARAFTYSAGDKLRLVIRYTAVVPTDVTIESHLKGGRGTLNLGRVSRHFGKKGLLQVSESLTDAEMSKAQAARSFFVKLSIPDTPGYCGRYYSWRLAVQKTAHNQVVWLQSDSVFGS